VNDRLRFQVNLAILDSFPGKTKARYPEPCFEAPRRSQATFPGEKSALSSGVGPNPMMYGRYSRCAMKLKRVAVYCGSANGTDAVYLAEARALGSAIAGAGLGMVYGGASVGLMGAVADAALAGGAEVIGVLPEVLAGSEIAHARLTQLEVVPTMHERKARMVHLADAFLILPGGYGTLDEMMEIVTWKQLRIHRKPCILINTASYWNGLLDFLDTTVEAGFLKAENRALLQVAPNPAEAVRMAIEG
jgi:uncharacterized protein (TIGR00730 family)